MLQAPNNKWLHRFTWRSIRVKMMLGLLLIVVPLIGFLIYSNMYAIEVVRNQVAESNKDLLTMYQDQVDRKLNEVDNYLFGLMSNSDFTGVMLGMYATGNGIESPSLAHFDWFQYRGYD